MHYTTMGDKKISRFGVGTKRMPITDVTRVDRLDKELATEISDAAYDCGVNFFDTSYSNHKGEAEEFLGEYFSANKDKNLYVLTSFFELVDPRFEYVFQKQLKKLQLDTIDFYTLEGVCDLNYMRDIDSGAVDFLFKQKEEGKIGQLGFSAELNAENLSKYAGLYPWDFVRIKLNFYDWYMRGVSEVYEAAKEAGLPIVAHAALHMGSSSDLKPEALKILKEANNDRSGIEWALLFVKSLDNVATLSCNMNSAQQAKENAAVFDDDVVLSKDELEVLQKCAQAQKTII